MSAVKWATTLHCDYPGCQSVGQAMAQGEPPAGWLGGSQGRYPPEVRDINGSVLKDFCTLHADVPLSKLFRALTEQAGT